MARLLLITRGFTMSGAEWLLCRLAIHLVARGRSVKVFATHDTHGPLLPHFEAASIPVVREVSELSPAEFDLAVVNTIFAAPVVLEIASRARTLWWLHEGEVGVEALVQQPGWLAAFRQCTHIVFQTRFQRDDVYRSFVYDLPPDRVSVIPNGIGPVPVTEPVPRTKRLRILCVGAICPRKRQEDLIRAVDALKREDIECVLLGKVIVPFEPAIQSIVQARPDIFRVVGELDPAATQAFFAGSDVFSLPSSSESQPLTAFEAGAHRLPLVLTDLPAYQGIWRHSHNCLTHAVRDVPVLAWTLTMLLQDASLRARLGQAAAATAASYPFDTFANSFEALIVRLVGMAKS